MATTRRLPCPGLAFLTVLALGAGCPAQTTWNYHATPARIERHAMTYDSVRGQVLSFAGLLSGIHFSASLSGWDGVRWTFPRAISGPPARHSHAMAFDSGRDRTVVFGGVESGTTRFDDTWEWDGRTWLRRTPIRSAPTRVFTSLAYDPLRRDTVLFGGDSGAGLDDTWSYM